MMGCRIERTVVGNLSHDRKSGEALVEGELHVRVVGGGAPAAAWCRQFKIACLLDVTLRFHLRAQALLLTFKGMSGESITPLKGNKYLGTISLIESLTKT